MHPQPAFHPTYARLLLALLQRRGEDPAKLLAAAGLSPAQIDADALLPLRSVIALITEAARASASPWLGLDLGAAAPLHTHGSVGFATLAAGNLGEAMQTLARFSALRTRALRLEIQSDAQHTHIRAIEILPLGEARCFVLETILVIWERLLETLSGMRMRDAHYALPWPRPPWAGQYAQVLAGTIAFDAPVLTLTLPNSVLSMRCLTADPEAYAMARRECERRLESSRPGREIAGRVRKQLLACSEHYPDAQTMAAQLHVSVRTLFRQLRAAGMSYQELLDEARREQAQWLLAHSPLPIEHIAERLGFADTTNFSRTFRRWCGQTPSAWRAQSAAKFR